ncbi:MAG: PDDEXK nuclease domain-containing protein [Planctomycetota bacterium]|nr:PDDEXK nuclease domain-containing protein [Planctomycetota bacterium]
MARKTLPANSEFSAGDYNRLLGELVSLLEAARRTSARAVNGVITATYWEIGRRIVEFEQRGEVRAEYGVELLKRLAHDLTARFGRGFSDRSLYKMRLFYLQHVGISPALSANSPERISPTLSAKSFPLPWSHYVKLLAVKDELARQFYATEALRGGWSVRQLDRQISSQFYERTLLSKNKSAMLRKASLAQPGDLVTPEDEIKDPLVLEFLDLKDEYSENDLEEALIHKLEDFLLELGENFAFIGRQKRLRIGDEWYRIDLLFFHRRLRCLVVIDLKIGKYRALDARRGESPPVGLVLCAQKDEAVAHYSLDNLPNKVLAREYRLALPDEKLLTEQLKQTQRALAARTAAESRTNVDNAAGTRSEQSKPEKPHTSKKNRR